jgi:hypothetical protein
LTNVLLNLYRRSAAILSLLLLTFALISSAIAQETTGGVEGVVKDATGATISNATVVLTGTALIGNKTLVTDGSGYYRFVNLSPGVYTVSASGTGFSELKREGIRLEVGRLPTINLTLNVGSDKTVVEVNTGTPQIDVTQSKRQTNVTRDQIDYQPRGRSYESVIAVAPGARYEPLQGGYQVDGGSTAENAYLLEGQETASLNSGKQVTQLPFEFIQEVQIKTSGIEAENGGALGGVINAIGKHGGNAWHGEVWTYYEGNPMDASPATTLRSQPDGTYCSTAVVASGPCASNPRNDFANQNYTPLKDHYRLIQPGATASGYLIKNRLWAFGGFAPYLRNARRTVNFTNATCLASASCLGSRDFNQSVSTLFTSARIDYKVTDKIRVFAGWQYSYERGSGGNSTGAILGFSSPGALTSAGFPNPDSREGTLNSSTSSPIDSFYQGIGYVAPNALYSAGADVTLTSSLVATTRFGRSYQNYADRDLPVGDRYIWDTNGVTATNIAGTATVGSLNPNAGRTTGTATLAANSPYGRQIYTRTSFAQDLAFFKKGFFGAHDLKGGYQLNHLSADINQQYTNDRVDLFYGAAYANQTATGTTNCSAIAATNATLYGATANTGCRGNYGYILLREGVIITGKASSNNHAFYLQDNWKIAKGLTANVGLRLEKENLPSFNQYQSGISFGLADKVAPRLGAAWDVFQNGKMKVFGSYAVYYDLMKLNLAIGSTGGNYWHNCAYALDTTDFTTIKPVKDATGHYCPAGTAATQGNFAGGATPAGLRFIENNNLRVPANDPASGTAVDPALKPYREHEAVFGVDYQISRSFTFESRWTRRRLDRVIEDIGYVAPAGEAFIIANPGFGYGAGGASPTCPTCKVQPKGERNYDGVEFRITKIASKHWFGSVAYTYSRLRGNYSGLTSTDIADAGGSRAAPNNNRAFDEPFLQFDAYGRSSNGLLATDRPNTYKVYGYYRFNRFLKNDVNIGLVQQSFSGTPLSSFADVSGAAGSFPVYVEGRGKWVPITRGAGGVLVYGTPYLRRTPWFNQTDLSFVDEYHVSDAHEAWRLGFEANISNALNSKTATVYQSRINATSSGSNYINPTGNNIGNPSYGLLEAGYDYKSISNGTGGTQGPLVVSNLYGMPSSFQTGRTIRFKLKFVY